MAVMDRSETRNHSNNGRDDDHHHGNANTNYLGVSRNSSKIGKAMSKRNPIQPPKQQPPVYNIDKNDFRNTVQRLTGSPASSEQQPNHDAPPDPPPLAANKPQSNARLQKIRPPPLSFAANTVPSQQAPLPTSSSVPRPSANVLSMNPFATSSPTFFSPLPPLTPGDEVWASASESPVNALYLRNPPKADNNSLDGSNNAFVQQNFAMNAWPDQAPHRASQWNPYPQKSLPRPTPNPMAEFYHSGSQLPVAPPASQQFGLSGPQFESPNLQFLPSPGALFPLSPLSGLAGGFQSPGSALFLPSPTARFAVPSPRGVAGFGVPNNIKCLTDSPTAGLTSHFSFPDQARHM